MVAPRRDTSSEPAVSIEEETTARPPATPADAGLSPAKALQDRLSAIFEPDLKMEARPGEFVNRLLIGLIIAFCAISMAGALLAYNGAIVI